MRRSKNKRTKCTSRMQNYWGGGITASEEISNHEMMATEWCLDLIVPLIKKYPFLLYLYATSTCHPTLNQMKGTLLYFLPSSWQCEQQNLRFSAIENNFFPLFYEVTRLKSIIKTGKVKTLKIILSTLQFAAQNRTHTIHATK